MSVIATVTLVLFHCFLCTLLDRDRHRKCLVQFSLQVPDDIPDDAVTVHLEYNKITTVPSNSFSKLRSCQRLYLIDNEISTIEERAFYGLSTITGLELQYNNITVLDASMFIGLENLELIYLYSNNIHTIQEDSFNVFRSMGRIYLHNNNIRSLPAKVFKDFDKVVALTLQNNSLENLPFGLFSGLKGIGTLYLQDNRIAMFEDGLFSGLTSVQSLGMGQRTLKNLRVDMFKGVTINKLTLEKTSIAVIEEGVFNGLGYLRELRMEDGLLTNLNGNIFVGLIRLIILTLNKNKLTVLKSNTFSTLADLETLGLAYNPISVIQDGAFNGLDRLKTLNISFNRITTLDVGILAPLPRPLTIKTGATMLYPEDPEPLVSWACDLRRCWLKKEQEARTIVLGKQIITCTNGIEWDQLTCPDSVPCGDPGVIDFAERSEDVPHWIDNSHPELPHSPLARFTYTCSSCHIGGGTITCLKHGQWTEKPTCEEAGIFCDSPDAIENGQVAPSGGRLRCGSDILYACHGGFTLEGRGTRTCGGDGNFTGESPSCVEIQSSRFMVGVVSGVLGGVLVTVMIAVTVCCIQRRGRNSARDGDHEGESRTPPEGGELEPGYTGLTPRDQGKRGKEETPDGEYGGYENDVYWKTDQPVTDISDQQNVYEEVDQ